MNNRNTIMNANYFPTLIPLSKIDVMNFSKRNLKTTQSYKRIVDKSPLSKSIPNFAQKDIKYPEYAFGFSSLLKKGRIITTNTILSSQKSKNDISFHPQVIRISSGNKTHLRASKYNAFPQTTFKKYSKIIPKKGLLKMQNSSNPNNTKFINNLCMPSFSLYTQKNKEDRIIQSLNSIESFQGKNLNSLINKKNIEDSNVIVKISNERRRELLFEAYQTKSILLELIKQSIQELKEKKRINILIRSYSKNQLAPNSPYSIINIKKKIKNVNIIKLEFDINILNI